jgi:hypothetical protein
VIYQPKFSRWALMGIAIVAVAAAAAAAGWTPRIPVDSCLFCGTGEPDSSSAKVDSGAGAATGGGFGTRAGLPEHATSAGSTIPAAAPIGPTSSATASRSSAGRSPWQPWAPSSAPFRAYSSAGKGPSPTLGGLWRLMTLRRPASTTGADVIAKNTAAPVPKVASPAKPAAPKAPPAATSPATAPRLTPPPQPAPSPTPVPAPEPAPSPAPPSAPSSPVNPAPPAPPTDQFHEHEPPSDGPPSVTPPLDPGGPGGGTPSGGGFSATPEPGSMLLIATGLGILGILYRRRLI